MWMFISIQIVFVYIISDLSYRLCSYQNSNPSLTPSASPSISNTRKNGPAPPPPPPSGAHGRPSVTGRPPHPAAKPPPPPLPPSQNKGNPVSIMLNNSPTYGLKIE